MNTQMLPSALLLLVNYCTFTIAGEVRVMISTLLMNTLRPREMKLLAQGHTAREARARTSGQSD